MSSHSEQRWNSSPEGREKAPQCGRRRRKVDVKLLWKEEKKSWREIAGWFVGLLFYCFGEAEAEAEEEEEELNWTVNYIVL